MHDAVTDYVAKHAPGGVSVLEFGSRNINGSVRDVIDATRYVGVDPIDGPGVDVVGDASTLVLDDLFDVVVCTEVLEHVDDDVATRIVANAWRHLDIGGVFIATMAGVGRHEHSAVDGFGLKPGEFYRNVDAATLTAWLNAAGFDRFDVDVQGLDIRCVAWKGGE